MSFARKNTITHKHKSDSQNTIKAATKEERMQLAELDMLIIRSKRKSISLHIKSQDIILRAPNYTPRVILKAFALSKINWLRKHINRNQALPTVSPKSYSNGEKWLLFGEEITLQVVKGKRSNTHYCPENKTLTITISSRVKNTSRYIQQRLSDWYKALALDYLENKARLFSGQMDLDYQRVSVRDYKARWGSCSSTGNLSFNWRIFMAPESVIDSVIVHELAHLRHFNHSKQFWQLVYSTCPDYKIQHQWLKTHQAEIQA